MLTRVQRAKKELQLNKIKILLQEKEVKVIEREEDILKIKGEMVELQDNIEHLENELKE